MQNNNLEKFLTGKINEKIIGQKENLSSAVMVLFCNFKGETYLLFEKRASNIVQGGEISFPGGKKDKLDKSFLDTAIRETFEEIGLEKHKISKIKNYGKLLRMTGEVIEVKLGCVEDFSMNDLDINYSEVEKIFLVPLKFFLETEPKIEKIMVENNPCYISDERIIKFPAKELNLPEKYWTPWGRERDIYFYEYENEIIWGITGEIIKSIICDMKNI